ncbi:MAG: ATP-binding cassette domain-containing protein [Mollicutes bacterium]|nr:ATP-binding cassette domain-containing protein [Mollicutes bacterium]
MNDLIIIKDLTFCYDKEYIFSRFNLNIKENSWVTLVGPNGSGKSTLIKILLGLYKFDGYISICQKILNTENLREIRSKIGVVFENPDNCFVAETVMDEIAFSLENLEIPKKEIKKRIIEVANLLRITNILEKNPHALSGGQKQLVALASALALEPKILILDEALTKIDNQDKMRILEIIKQLHHEKKMTIVNATHDIEEAVYGDDIIVIDKGKIVLKGPKELVLKEEKIFRELGLGLPFMASLSLKLQYYNLIDKMILDMDELVNVLWK